MTKSFEDSNQKTLGFTVVCPKGHCDPKGNNVKFKYAKGLAGECAACHKRMPDGPYEKIFEYLYRNLRVKKTPEERAAGAVQASMKWNAKNKDKTATYIKKYQSKPETRAHRKEFLDNLPDEEKEKRRAKQVEKSKAWYDANIRKSTSENKEKYQDRWRLVYSNLTKEQKEVRRERDRAYRERKKAEKVEQQRKEDNNGDKQ